METATKPASKQSSSKSQDAVALLRADHKAVNDLFEEFEKARAATRKQALAQEICMQLTVHAQIEEEIFYPAYKLALKDHELVPEAEVEHATLKDLIAQIQSMEPEGEEFEAKVKVLGEYVQHHVKEEHTEMFPKAKESRKLDLQELGEQLAQRKQELLARQGA